MKLLQHCGEGGVTSRMEQKGLMGDIPEEPHLAWWP